MVSYQQRPYELIGLVGGITPSHMSYQVLTKFLPTQAVDGTTGGWFVIPVRKWYQDCKVLCCTDLKKMYVELGREAKNIYVSGTQCRDI
jgi:hypothetical protein